MKIPRARGHEAAGFTLIELMMVIIVVSVLMAVALPAYQNQVLRGHRATVKGEMMEIANRQEQFLLANRAYTADPNDFAYALPAGVADRYIVTVTASTVTAPYFLITATPQGMQVKDGTEALTLDSQGEKLPEGKWAR